MHFRIILGNLNPTVWLALNKKKRQLQLLGRVGHRLIDIQSAMLVVQKLICDLDVALLELGDGDLLLDQLKEQFLLVSDAFTRLRHFCLPFLHHSC